MLAYLNTSKHMQYPPNQQNWATDSVCCTAKECGRSREQHTARFATVTSQLNAKCQHSYTHLHTCNTPLINKTGLQTAYVVPCRSAEDPGYSTLRVLRLSTANFILNKIP